MNTLAHVIAVTADTLDEIITLGAKLSQEERTYEPQLTFDREAAVAHYKKELENPNALLIAAALEDGTIVGYQYSYIETLAYLEAKNKQCTLEALYVLPTYRGAGIGELLTQHAHDWAVSQGVNRITTHIYTDNKASLQLHEKHGFSAYNTELVKYI